MSERLRPMQKTITIDDELYVALSDHVGTDDIDHYVEELIRSRLNVLENWPTDEELEAGYREMAADEEREREAHEWSEAFIGETLP